MHRIDVGRAIKPSLPSDTLDQEPDWSPDGSQLVYFGWREGRPRLFIINVDGTGDRLFTVDVPPNHSYDMGPAWSLATGLIAFSRAIDGPDGMMYTTGIYTIRPDGTGLTEIASSPGAMDSPRWRP